MQSLSIVGVAEMVLSALNVVIFEVSESEQFDSVDVEGSELIASVCFTSDKTATFVSLFDDALVSTGTIDLGIFARFSDDAD